MTYQCGEHIYCQHRSKEMKTRALPHLFSDVTVIPKRISCVHIHVMWCLHSSVCLRFCLHSSKCGNWHSYFEQTPPCLCWHGALSSLFSVSTSFPKPTPFRGVATWRQLRFTLLQHQLAASPLTCLCRLSSSISKFCRKRCLSTISPWAPLRASLLSFTSLCTASSWKTGWMNHMHWLHVKMSVLGETFSLLPSCGTTDPLHPCSSSQSPHTGYAGQTEWCPAPAQWDQSSPPHLHRLWQYETSSGPVPAGGRRATWSHFSLDLNLYHLCEYVQQMEPSTVLFTLHHKRREDVGASSLFRSSPSIVDGMELSLLLHTF